MKSFIVNRVVFHVLLVMVVGHWIFRVGYFLARISRLISNYTENDKKQL